MVQDQEADCVTQGLLAAKEPLAAFQFIEHARADFRVAKEVHFAVFADRARLDLADVVEQRRPPYLESRYGLNHDLLGVFPDVLVSPLAVAESDHRFDFGKQGVEHPCHQQ